MSVKVSAVPPRSLAARMGIRAGDALRAINGEPVYDAVDYRALDAQGLLCVELERGGAVLRARAVNKNARTLGIELGQDDAPRTCRNACVFCFVDQLPGGVRPSLRVKDDDWRASLTAGNFVTLTNVDDAEFERILRRRASPLFISVHATDGNARARMMRNPAAARLMERLRALKDAGLQFHAQIVLCPGYNDGDVLDQTIRDLAALWPAAQSVAIVPLGLTAHRAGLTPLKPITPEQARELIKYVELYQTILKRRLGTRLVYLADEFYLKAGCPPPPCASYEGFPQLANGVGLLGLFERQYLRARERRGTVGGYAPPNPAPKGLHPFGIPHYACNRGREQECLFLSRSRMRKHPKDGVSKERGGGTANGGIPTVQWTIGKMQRRGRKAEAPLWQRFGGSAPDVPSPSASPHTLLITGVSAAPWMRRLLLKHPIEGVTERVRVVPVISGFFGAGVTVAGLVTGGDIAAQVRPGSARRALIPRSMLRAEGDVFLDGMTPGRLSELLRMPVIPIDVDGAALARQLMINDGR